VVLADSQPIFREAVASAIRDRDELELVAEASEGGGSVALVERLAPDVAVLGARMPGLEGMQALRALRARGSETSVILFSGFLSGQLVHEALAAGAMGVYSTEAGGQEICDAIVRVGRGEVLVDPRIASRLLDTIRQRGQRDQSLVCSSRELEVLKLVSDGLSTPQIAKELYLSQETIKSHLKAIYGKLGVSARSAAVAEAMRLGLLD
jgi:two-component system nitrate/nitrite response regulator NarL